MATFTRSSTRRGSARRRLSATPALLPESGDGTFEEIAKALGGPLALERVSRGSAVGDLDNDGRLDVVVNDLDGSPQVLRNELPKTGNWLIGSCAAREPTRMRSVPLSQRAPVTPRTYDS